MIGESSMSSGSVMLDVTSVIGAEEYIKSCAMHSLPGDPLALQAYAHLVQTVLLYDQVFVPHPTILASPTVDDFGTSPALLCALMKRDIIRPLCLTLTQTNQVSKDEEALIKWLQSNGAEVLSGYFDSLVKPEDATSPSTVTSQKLKAWVDYHEENVRSAPGHHVARIGTKHGVEEDEIGDFAGAFSNVFLHRFDHVALKPTAYLVGFFLSALRYRVRANIAKMPYQAHILRRDFAISTDVNGSGYSHSHVMNLLDLVRGVHETLRSKAGSRDHERIELLELRVPLLGGKLWTQEDTKRDPDSFLALVVDRITEYRDKTAVLRNTVAAIHDEDGARQLARDFEAITQEVLEACGLQRPEITETDTAIIEAGAAVSGAIPGVPNMKGLLITIPALVKRLVFSGSNPLRQFVYREYMRGWKITK